MAAFKYELIDDGEKVVAVTWNDAVVWILGGNDDAAIYQELYLEQGYNKAYVLSESGFIAQCKLALGVE